MENNKNVEAKIKEEFWRKSHLIWNLKHGYQGDGAAGTENTMSLDSSRVNIQNQVFMPLNCELLTIM